MPERMLAALGDMLQNPATPSGAELLELTYLTERAESAMSGRDRNIPGSTWIGDQFLDLCRRRMAGKPITRAEVQRLTEHINDHAVWVHETYGVDVHTDGWERTQAMLAHLAATAERPSPLAADDRRRQQALFGLLTAAVLDPPTWRCIGRHLPL